MMELETVVMVGRKPVKLSFTEGSVNSLGSQPARYTTDSLLMQVSIERSKQYKSGLIKRLRVAELDEEVKVGRNIFSGAECPAEAGQKQSTEAAEQSKETAGQKQSEETAEQSKEGLPSPIRVEFEINDDAKDYLADNFGVTKSRLHNREEIIACGKEHGVEIVFV